MNNHLQLRMYKNVCSNCDNKKALIQCMFMDKWIKQYSLY